MKRVSLVIAILAALLVGTAAQAAVTPQARGNLYTELLYTPEDLLKIQNRAQFNIDILAGSNQAKLILGGVWQGLTPFWEDNFGGSAGGNMANFEQALLEIQGPFFMGGPDIKLAAGHMFILGYPAWAARLDAHSNPGGWSNGVRRAARFEDLRFNIRDASVDAKGFITWEKNKPDSYGMGTSVGVKYGKWDTRITAVGYHESQRIEIDGESGYYGAPLERDTVVGVEVSGPLHNKVSLQLTGAWHQNGKRSEEDVTVLDTESSLMIDGNVKVTVTPDLSVTVGYRDYPAEFDPKYRDRAEDNLVSTHSDRTGVFAEVTTHVLDRTVQLDANVARYTSHAEDPTVFSKAGLGASTKIGETSLKASFSTERTSPPEGEATTKHELSLDAESVLLRQRAYLVQGFAGITFERGSTESNAWDVEALYTQRSGVLRNFQLGAGLIGKTGEELAKYIRTAYTFPFGAKLEGKITWPNNPNDTDEKYDNFLRVSMQVDF